MAVQKQLLKGVLAGALALMLSGCVTIPDAIKGSSRCRSRIWCG
jgi:outer membrane lipoprotein